MSIVGIKLLASISLSNVDIVVAVVVDIVKIGQRCFEY